MPDRRNFLKTVAATSGALLAGRAFSREPIFFGPSTLPQGLLDTASLETLPGKRPLIKKSFRPPNYETPIAYFKELYTPNDAFFVRYHVAVIPEVAAAQWKLKIGGEGAQKPYELTLGELKTGFEQTELPALCMCSGNRRGLFEPHAAGVEWGYGAMGNARWKGVRLRDILNKAGIKKETVEVGFNGADGPVMRKTPDFQKSIPTWKALDENTLVAYEMNGQALPHWNGFPVRVVVPGWTATYWMKHLRSIELLTSPMQNFWMKTAYRIPKGKFPVVDRFISQEAEINTPITEMVANSLILTPESGGKQRAGQLLEVTGIAWDGGYGIQRVEVSVDDGQSWREAELGRDAGRFSWRQWRYVFKPEAKGRRSILAKASNRVGQTQTFELIANPAGYHHNVIQRVELVIV